MIVRQTLTQIKYLVCISTDEKHEKQADLDWNLVVVERAILHAIDPFFELFWKF